MMHLVVELLPFKCQFSQEIAISAILLTLRDDWTNCTKCGKDTDHDWTNCIKCGKDTDQSSMLNKLALNCRCTALL